MMSKVITIDGPAAAGKTTLARKLSETLKIGVLNVGSLYRAATWVMRDRKLHEADSEALRSIFEEAHFHYEEGVEGSRVWAFDREITSELRDPELTREIKVVANQPDLREWMNDWQRRICAHDWKVVEGRDEGTEVFPDSPAKIFLTASLDVRHQRRLRQLLDQGVVVDDKVLYKDMEERDRADRERPVGALRPAETAFILESSHMTHDEVHDAALHWIVKNLKNREEGLPVTFQ